MKPPKLGSRICGCGACRRYFTGTSPFDKHRAWDGDRRVCRNPADVGLVQRPNGAWGGPPMTEQDKRAAGWA